MSPEQPATTEDPRSDSKTPASDKVPFDQVLRRLLDAKAKKQAPKPGKPPRKL